MVFHRKKSFFGTLRSVHALVNPLLRNRRPANCKTVVLYTLVLLCMSGLMYSKFISRHFQRQNVVRPCSFPKINFYDKSLEKVLYPVPVERCDVWEDLVFFDDSGVLRMNDTAIKRSGHADLKCTYSMIDLPDQNTVAFSEFLFDVPSHSKSDFVHVQCKNTFGTVVYSNLHYKLENKTVLETKKIGDESRDQLSVILLGIDSVSRLVGERKLSVTMNYMRDQLNAYVFKGYTKVGDNTLPNQLAMLLGKSILELAVPTFDYPAVYREVVDKGYIDCYAEDWALHWPYLGFKYPFYTHYLRKLFLAKEKVDIFMTDPLGEKRLNLNKSEICFGNKLQYQILMDYTKKCIASYDNKLKYVYMWQNELCHSRTNELELIDQDLRDLLKWMKDTNRLQNSVVMLVSDHGPRIGPIVWANDIGRFTARLPLFALVIPNHLKQRYPHLHENLLWNTEKLTTHFDFHETLKDIFRRNFDEKKSFTHNGRLPRGISLFRKIPNYRSCFDAAVSEHYCPCYSFTDISVHSSDVAEVANFMVNTINELLLKYEGRCTKLEISKIVSAKIQHAPKADKETEADDTNNINYVITFMTLPSNGVFEGTAKRHSNGHMSMLGYINRLNKYGNQSSCIYDPIKYDNLFCYCGS